MGSNRSMVSALVARVAIGAAVIASAAACTTQAGPPPTSGGGGGGQPTHTAGPSTPTPTGPGHYSVVSDLCTKVDISAATAVLPFTDAQEHENLTTALGTQMQCGMEIGYSDDFEKLATLQIEVDVDPSPTVATTAWQGNRDFAMRGGSKPVSVPGLGQAAFQYLDKDIGYRLDAYDGNAEVIVIFKGFDPAFKVPSNVNDILFGVASGTLAKLRGGG
jgi:hypothetical protein